MTELDQQQPPTPDFYRYRWLPLHSAQRDGRFVELRWDDGAELRVYDLWLLENVVGQAIDLATRESVLDPADLDLDTTIERAELTEAGALHLTWTGDDRGAVFHPGWLHHIAAGAHRTSSWLPQPAAWLAESMAAPPTHDGRAVLDDRSVMSAWLHDLLRFGIARLSNLPLDPEFVVTLMSRVGAIRDTNFGLSWDVKALVEPDSTANTNYRLCPHTDLPTRETPPGFQFLHCLANTAEGGHSTMADGMAVAAHLAQHEPAAYQALTTLKWIFFNRSTEADHRWSGPVIDLGVDGAPLTIRAFHPVRAFPDMDEADLPRAYEALKLFSATAADPRFQMRYPFRPGDMVGFDNRRILHGREAYESGGHRHLRGLYMDHDELYSFARRQARAEAETALSD